MNRNRFREIACILPVLLVGVSTARGDDKAVGRRPIRATETLGTQRYAVIIGIDDYRDKQIPDLKFAEGDARAVYDVLTDSTVGGIKKENATLLVGKTATTRNIRKALAELRTIPKDATVFIFFSGHGAKESGDAFWVTYDSELGGLAFSAMPDREIRALTNRIPSSRLIMLLDCCYAAATVKEQKSVVDLGDILKKFVGKGRVTITASGSGEEAIEAKDLKRGVFTYYLLQALRGAADGLGGAADGIVTVPELTAYIDKTVAEASRRRKGIQKPAIFMEEVQDPAKFLVTIDPAKMASLAEAARRQSEQVKARLGILKRLFIDEKLTPDQYRLGKDLFGRNPSVLSKQDQERVDIFVDMIDGKIPADRLTALLGSVESPEQRVAHLERERVAAEVKTTLGNLRRAFDRKDVSRAYRLFETLKRLSPDDPQVAIWTERLKVLQPPTLKLDPRDSRADLQVPKVLLCTNIDGYGIYDPIDPPEFIAGRRNEVVLYIEVDNYKSERIATGPKQGSQRTLLTVRQSLLRQDGHEIWNHTDENIEDISRDRRRDFFLSAKVVIPKALSPGDYVLKVEVTDELAGKINSNTVKFKMLPGRVVEKPMASGPAPPLFEPVQIRIPGAAMGPVPFYLEYAVDLPRSVTQRADILWMDNGVWIGDKPEGVKILDILGLHRISVLVITRNNRTFRGRAVVQVTATRPSDD